MESPDTNKILEMESQNPEAKAKADFPLKKTLEKNILMLESITDEIVVEMRKNVNKGIRSIFRDIEISFRDFLALLLTSFAVVTLALVNFYYSGDLVNRSKFLGGTGIGSGIIIGITIGALYVDLLDKRYPIIISMMLIASGITIIGITSHNITATWIPIVIFSLNIIIVIFLVIQLFVMFIEYTTMLERGRVIAMIMVLLSLLAFTLLRLLTYPNLGAIPILIPVFVSWYLWDNKHREKSRLYFLEKLQGDSIDSGKTIYKIKEKLNEKRQQKNSQAIMPEKEKAKEEIIQNAKPHNKPDGKLKVKKKGEREQQRQERRQIVHDHIQAVRERVKEQRTSKKFLKFLFTNSTIIKYLLVIYFTSIIIGLLVPVSDIVDSIILREYMQNISVLAPIVITIGAFIIGLIFDFYGRKATISVLIFIVAIFNFFSLFSADTLSNPPNLALFIGLVFSMFISIPLINGDISREEFFGRTNVLSMIVALLGLASGVILKEGVIATLLEQIDIHFLNEAFGETLEPIIYYHYSISSLIFLACIIGMFILANIKSDQSPEEIHWPKKLIHLYVIHNSGLLLYEHAFREESDLATADLVSGGFIGVVSILREITKGKQDLRIIDHGDKKLLFQWGYNDQVVYVLVIERELVIIRHKLTQFIEAFEEKFKKNLEQFAGVNEDAWKGTQKLINIYFTRKYLNWIPTLNSPTHDLDPSHNQENQ